MAWGRDNWRMSGAFNNHSILVEVRLLYRCREAFMGSAPITNLLEDTLDPLGAHRGLAENNSDLVRDESSRGP